MRISLPLLLWPIYLQVCYARLAKLCLVGLLGEQLPGRATAMNTICHPTSSKPLRSRIAMYAHGSGKPFCQVSKAWFEALHGSQVIVSDGARWPSSSFSSGSGTVWMAVMAGAVILLKAGLILSLGLLRLGGRQSHSIYFMRMVCARFYG